MITLGYHLNFELSRHGVGTLRGARTSGKLILLLLTACGGTQANEQPIREYPSVLVAPSTFQGNFAAEQEITVRHPQGENTFRAVLQKQGDRIVVLGLAPHGGRGFTLIQDGMEVSFETHVDLDLPFPPRYMLYDVHRTWFVAPDAPAENRAWQGEQLIEEWQGDQLMSRTFSRDGFEGTIRVEYGPGMAIEAPLTGAPPDEVVLESDWFHYQMTIRTLSWTAIP